MKKNTEAEVKKPSMLWKKISIQLSNKEKLIFVKYLAVLLKSGLAIDNAINILFKQSKGPLKKILDGLNVALKRGDSLASGLSEYSHVFSPIMINLIMAGESSGNLQGNLEHLALQMQKDYELKQKIRGAMMYPLFIIGAAVLISIGIIVFILPNITGLFSSLKVEIPLPTRILLWISDAIQNNGLIVLLVIISFVIAILLIRRIEKLKPFFHKILLTIPLFGNIAKMMNIARFTRLMGTMTKSGISIDDTVPTIISVLNNAQYKNLFRELLAGLKQGNTITSVFEKHPFLVPPMAMRIIYVGEESGSLEEMLLYVAEFYELEIDEITKNLSTLIEPFLLIIVGVMVGGLALSILMPIYQIVGSF